MTDEQTQMGAVEPTTLIDPAAIAPESLAWEHSAELPDIEPEPEPRRPLPRALLGLLGFVAVAGLALGAFVLGARVERRDDVAQLQPTTVTQTVTQTPSAEQFLAYHDDAFTKALTDAAIPVGNMNEAVASGQGWCHFLGSGHRTAAEQDDYLQMIYPNLTPIEQGHFAGLAIRAFCTQFTYVFANADEETGQATS